MFWKKRNFAYLSLYILQVRFMVSFQDFSLHKTLLNLFRRPSQLCWRASNSQILGEAEEGEKLAFWAFLSHLLDSFRFFLNLLESFGSFGIFWTPLDSFDSSGVLLNLLDSWEYLGSFGTFWIYGDSKLMRAHVSFCQLMQARASSEAWKILKLELIKSYW